MIILGYALFLGFIEFFIEFTYSAIVQSYKKYKEEKNIKKNFL